MKSILLIPTGVLGAALCFAGTAAALPESVNRIPHGTVFGCETCHPGGETKELNHLGTLLQGIRHAHVAPEGWWTIMYNTDSDGDGLTNGEELGDPCGEWVIGSEQPDVKTVSNPGDEASRLKLGTAPNCPPLPVADDGSGSTDVEPATPTVAVSETACAFFPGRANGSAGASVAVAVLGLSILLRRGRPRTTGSGANKLSARDRRSDSLT